MNNYVLSIDPSMKNTGFTLWEKRECIFKHNDGVCICVDKCCELWKPIWINNYSFNKYSSKTFMQDILLSMGTAIAKNKFNNFTADNLRLIIERGIHNSKFGQGKETLEHLRGFIGGQFHKLLTKEILVTPDEWWIYCEEKYADNIKIWTENIWITFTQERNVKNAYLDKKQISRWRHFLKKHLTILLATHLVTINNWDIEINDDHDRADSLLLGLYVIERE